MDITDLFHLFVRWTHLVSAGAWVGGSIFWILVLNPSTRQFDSDFTGRLQSQISSEFRGLVDTCIFVLLTTGAIMAFNRLTPGNIGYQYALILGLKIIFVAMMFYLIRAKRHPKAAYVKTNCDNTRKSRLRQFTKIATGYNLVLLLGLVVYLLSDLLNMIYMAAVSN
ncbi:MAG: CopD family protein [Dehalococcoidia bacterium]